MKLTSKIVKEAAFRAGCGDVGIAGIDRFADASRMMHPKNIFPEQFNNPDENPGNWK